MLICVRLFWPENKHTPMMMMKTVMMTMTMTTMTVTNGAIHHVGGGGAGVADLRQAVLA